MPGPLPFFSTQKADYWRQSRRPLVGLAFTLPLLLVYEAGMLFYGGATPRNGADVWLRNTLDAFGLTGYFLLPLLTVCVLLAWHHTTRDRWSIPKAVLVGMFLESAMLGLILLFVVHVQGALLSIRIVGHQPGAMQVAPPADLSRMISYLGAGIYEEVLFRLLLLPLLFALIGSLGASVVWSRFGAVLLAGLAFSLAHYVGPYGDSFAWFSFTFRFLAGAFFSGLFVVRGFGIAAGSHALYDIFVSVL
ncbi:MAG: type II CAAX prenyl endopeptidase Rce1 family protein [Pirellulales bacterium]